MPQQENKAEIVDLPSPVTDVYVDDILSVGFDGATFRLTFTTSHTRGSEPPKIARVITARLAMPASVMANLCGQAQHVREMLEQQKGGGEGPKTLQ